MTTLAALVGLGIAGIGVALGIAPGWLPSLGNFRSRAMLWTSGASRILIGVIFVRAAPDTSAPLVFQVLGGISAAVGVAILFLPLAAWQSLIDSVLDQAPAVYRSIGVFATLFGLGLVYLV